MLCIKSPRTLGSHVPILIDIPIKEVSRLGEEERAREQRSYCGWWRVEGAREKVEEDGRREEEGRLKTTHFR